MARMVVMAELMMETPMKEMAAITLFTLTGAPAVNCEEECMEDLDTQNIQAQTVEFTNFLLMLEYVTMF